MSFKRASLSIIAVLCVAFVFISIILDDSRVEAKGKRETRASASSAEKLSEERKRKREAHYITDDWDDDNEVTVGRKKFKMFEKKKLNHKKAQAVCKKKDGHLAYVTNLEEMTRLQTLLMRAKTVGDDIWVGADKKEWKKHALKVDKSRPNFGPGTTMFGGGPQEMCSALSVSTRSLNPVMCMKELAFICEFELNKPTTTMKPTTTAKTTKSKIKTKKESGNTKTNKVKGRNKNKVEMKRRKREITPTTISVIEFPSPVGMNIMKKTNDTDQAGKKEDQEDNREDSDSEEDDDTGIENFVTENPTEAAAEHNIGFSPHVEHMLLQIEKEHVKTSSSPSKLEQEGSETPILVDENSIQSVESPSFDFSIQVKVSTKITIDDSHLTHSSHNITKPTTTVDPDQQLIDLIDEQTMNLTAIEMEAANLYDGNLSTHSPTENFTDNENFKGKGGKKTSEFIDENDLAAASDISHAHLENDNNDDGDDEKTRKKKENELRSSSDEFGDNSTILSFDYYRDDTNGSSSSRSSSVNSYISNKSESETFTTDSYNLTDSVENTNNSNVTTGYFSVNDNDNVNQLNTYTDASTLLPNLNDDANLTTEIMLEEKVGESNKRPIRNVSHTIQMYHDNNIEDQVGENIIPTPLLTLKDKLQNTSDVKGLNETSTNSSSSYTSHFNSSFNQINETIEETGEIGENSTTNMTNTNIMNTIEIDSNSTSPQSFQLPIIEKSQHSITQKPFLLSANEMIASTLSSSSVIESSNMVNNNPSINATNTFTTILSTTDEENEINSLSMSTSIDNENSTASSADI